MNRDTYTILKATIPNFDVEHTRLVPVADIVFDKKTSQCRSSGHVIQRVPEFARKYEAQTPLPPPSVRNLPNGKVELKDGCTRVLGAEKAKIEEIRISDYHDTELKYGPGEWEDFQYVENDHIVGTPNSDGDIERCISEQVQNGRLAAKLGFKYKGNEQKFIDEGAKHYQKVMFKNSGHRVDWYANRIKTSLAGCTAQSFENYTKELGFALYCSHTGFLGGKVGEISNNQAVYVFHNPDHKSPQIVGNSFTKRMKNSGVKIELVYWVGGLAGKTNDDVIKERKDIEDWYDTVTKFYPGFFNALYFLPQIKIGCSKHPVENMFQLIKIR